jgi:preprotein translocase subunit YajC
MRVHANKEKFVSDLAGHVTASKSKIVVVADSDKIDIKEEAKQSAISYWMMGWNWDEIEGVLEDSEYSTAAVSYALKEAKEYAKKILNEGPFAVMKEGQGVKLTNGEVGTVDSVFSDHVKVSLSGSGKVKVTAAHIDLDATNKLGKAFALREEAAAFVAQITGENPVMKTASTVIRVSLENTETGLAADLSAAIARLSALQQASDDLRKNAAELNSTWKSEHEQWQTRSADEQTFAQYVTAMITQEGMVNDEVQEKVHGELRQAAAVAHDLAVENPTIEDAAAVQAVTKDIPKVIQAIETHVYDLNQKNAMIQEYVHKFQNSTIQDWRADAVNWSKQAWNDTKTFVHVWENRIKPLASSAVDALSKFSSVATSKSTQTSVGEALVGKGL